jgi:hypothetical protein
VLIVKKNQQLKFRFTFVGDARATSTTSTNSKNISFKQILNNKAIITTTVNHGFQVGQAVTIAGVDTVFNGLHTIEEVTNDTFSYRTVESNVSVVVSSGTASVTSALLNGGLSYDPIANGSDVTVSVYRGLDQSGAIIGVPISYRYTNSTTSPDAYIERNGTTEFVFNYRIPENIEAQNSLFSGIYTIVARTYIDGNLLSSTVQFELKDTLYDLVSGVGQGNKSTTITYKPSYDDLNQTNMQSILLIGHADGLELNNPVKINSVQNAIDLLSGNKNSPLLRGVLDAYGAGARNIFICAAAPMSEYVLSVEDRNKAYAVFNGQTLKTFYEKYYERLIETYSIIKQLDYIDIIVPLEASIIKTGGVDFLSQLVHYCNDFHNETGYVQIGVIGSRGNGISSSDIELIQNSKYLRYKYTTFINTTSSTQIASDIGRYVVPVYGEAVFSHLQIDNTYTASVAAAVAGMIAQSQLNMGLTRKRIPGALSLYGVDLNSTQLNTLDSIGINTIYRGTKARRGNVYEVYLTSDYTLSNVNSVFSKLPQMRLTSYVASQVKAYGYDYIGKFGHDKVVTSVTNMLSTLKKNGSIVDYEFKAEQSEQEQGLLILNINLTSSLGLKKINLSLSAGPAA